VIAELLGGKTREVKMSLRHFDIVNQDLNSCSLSFCSKSPLMVGAVGFVSASIHARFVVVVVLSADDHW
jgi:hypothetical protein